MTEITRDEWLQALEQSEAIDSDGMRTTNEWAQLLGCSITPARKWLWKGLNAGWIERGRTAKPSLSGVMRHEPAYRIVEAKSTEGKQ